MVVWKPDKNVYFMVKNLRLSKGPPTDLRKLDQKVAKKSYVRISGVQYLDGYCQQLFTQ